VVFERLDPSARRAFELGQEEAVRLQHNYLGTEHLLIGLSRTDTFAARLLTEHHCGTRAVRAAVLEIIGRGRPLRDRDQLLATIGIDLVEVRRRAQATFGTEAIVSAAARARLRGRRRPPRWWPNCSIGRPCESTLAGDWHGVAPRLEKIVEMATRHAAPERATPTHLLLAIVQEGKGVACQILERLGVDLALVVTATRADLA